MATKRDYAYETAEQYNTVAGNSSGITRSEAQKKAERDAYDRMERVYESSRKSGAGRGPSKASDYKRKTKR